MRKALESLSIRNSSRQTSQQNIEIPNIPRHMTPPESAFNINMNIGLSNLTSSRPSQKSLFFQGHQNRHADKKSVFYTNFIGSSDSSPQNNNDNNLLSSSFSQMVIDSNSNVNSNRNIFPDLIYSSMPTSARNIMFPIPQMQQTQFVNSSTQNSNRNIFMMPSDTQGSKKNIGNNK